MANSSTPYCWDTDPSGNATADSAIPLPPGTLEARLLDDRMRATMAVFKKHFEDRDDGCTVGGSANAITLTSKQGIDTLQRGIVLMFQASATNTGPVTVALNALGSTQLRDRYDVNLVGGEIVSGTYNLIHYDGTRWRLLASTAGQGAPALLAGFDLGGGPNAFTLTAAEYVIPEVDHTMIGVVPNDDNTGDVTIAINGAASRQVRNIAGEQLLPGQFREDRYYLLRFTGTWWYVVNTPMQDDYSRLGFGTGGGPSAYTLDTGVTSALETLYHGLLLVVTWHITNSGACTFKLNGTAAKSIKLHGLQTPAAGDLVLNTTDLIRYDEGENAWIVVTKDQVGERTYGSTVIGSASDMVIANFGGGNDNDESDPVVIDQVMAGSSVDVILRGHCLLTRGAHEDEGPELWIGPIFHNGTSWNDAGPEEEFTHRVTGFLGVPDEPQMVDQQYHIAPRRWGSNFVFIFRLNNTNKFNASTWRVGAKVRLDPNEDAVGPDSEVTIRISNIDIMYIERQP